jgi:hypothetical protein
MSAVLIGAALGVLVSVLCGGSRPRQYPGLRLKQPPAPQPRTKEEARRWRAEWEARK